MKTIATSCLLLMVALRSGIGYAEDPTTTGNTAEVQNNLESIVANCEKKKLLTEQEINCIEQGYLKFMGEDVEGGS